MTWDMEKAAIDEALAMARQEGERLTTAQTEQQRFESVRAFCIAQVLAYNDQLCKSRGGYVSPDDFMEFCNKLYNFLTQNPK